MFLRCFQLSKGNFFLFLSGLFSQQSNQSVPNQQVAPLAQLAVALSQPQIYGDERDGIIAKLNQVQAYWGTGKGFYNQQSAVDFTPQNPFCRFKVRCLYHRSQLQGAVWVCLSVNTFFI